MAVSRLCAIRVVKRGTVPGRTWFARTAGMRVGYYVRATVTLHASGMTAPHGVRQR